MSVDFYALRSTRHHAARAFPLVAEWLDHLAYRDLAETTRDDYERTVAEFVLWRDRERNADGSIVTAQQIARAALANDESGEE